MYRAKYNGRFKNSAIAANAMLIPSIAPGLIISESSTVQG
jgi:hypothetical protein